MRAGELGRGNRTDLTYTAFGRVRNFSKGCGLFNNNQMGKKTKHQETLVTVQTYRIRKDKTLANNLNDYIKFLKAKHSHLKSKQYIRLIHQFISRAAKKISVPGHVIQKAKTKFKICKTCDKWAIGTRKMVQCSLCEDHFHVECADSYTSKEQEWKCPPCIQILLSKEKEHQELMKAAQVRLCFGCKKANKNQKQMTCIKCLNFYHQSCYGGSSVVCQTCDSEIEKKMRADKQISLRESFRKSQVYQSSKKKIKKEHQQERLQVSFQKFTKKQQLADKLLKRETQTQTQPKKESNFSKSLADQSTKASIIEISPNKTFRASFPAMTQSQILKYKQNLLRAILSKNMQYSEQLQCHNCSLYDDNESSLDFAIKHLSYSDLKMLKEYKKQPIGPFLLNYRQQCGYDVVADKDLPAGMIVCEYVGDVYTHRETLALPKNDSVMELKIGSNADQSLFIVPTHWTNIARFINGVNAKDPKRREKENLRDMHALANGRPIVILYTVREIKKGESLMYDYGAGEANVKYDTSDYV